MSDYDPPMTPLEVLHEDHEILVVAKPPGLLSVPGKGSTLPIACWRVCRRRFPWRCWCIGWTGTRPA